MGAGNNFFKDMLACREVISRKKDVEAGRIYVAVETFVKSGTFTTYRRASELIKLTLGGYKDSYIAHSFGGVRPDYIRGKRSDLSIQLYSLFGEGFFSLLADYSRHKDEVNARVTSVCYMHYKAEDLLPNESLVLLGVSSFIPSDEISLKECKNELIFLNRYCLESMRRDFKKLDKAKFDYLVRILDGKVGTPIDRYKVLSMVADFSDKDLAEMVKLMGYGENKRIGTGDDVPESVVRKTLFNENGTSSFREDSVANNQSADVVDRRLDVIEETIGCDDAVGGNSSVADKELDKTGWGTFKVDSALSDMKESADFWSGL